MMLVMPMCFQNDMLYVKYVCVLLWQTCVPYLIHVECEYEFLAQYAKDAQSCMCYSNVTLNIVKKVFYMEPLTQLEGYDILEVESRDGILYL